MQDIINQKFGNLTVTEYHSSIKNVGYRGSVHIYKCLCDCGVETLVRRGNLKSGHTVSCGCLRGKAFREKMRVENNLSGQVFGRLTALDRNVENFKKFNCLCECGNTVSVQANDLKNGHTRSCGCLKKEISSAFLEEYKQSLREAKGLDPFTPIGKEDDLERIVFRKTTQQVILQRDNFSCVWCSRNKTYLHVHHLDTWKSSPGRRFDPTNLVTLCVECHKNIHNRSYHKDVDPIMTILLKGYSEMEYFNMADYFETEKSFAARKEITPN